jgi:cytochrome b561
MTQQGSWLAMRPLRGGGDQREAMARRQQMGRANRVIGWLLLPVLLMATTSFRYAESSSNGRFVATFFSWLLISLTFLHSGISFYVFGGVRPRPTLRVFHVYFGYLTFVLVMLSQTTINGPKTFHFVTSVLMYIAILGHTVMGSRYQVLRKRAQRDTPDLVPANTR